MSDRAMESFPRSGNSSEDEIGSPERMEQRSLSKTNDVYAFQGENNYQDSLHVPGQDPGHISNLNLNDCTWPPWHTPLTETNQSNFDGGPPGSILPQQPFDHYSGTNHDYSHVNPCLPLSSSGMTAPVAPVENPPLPAVIQAQTSFGPTPESTPFNTASLYYQQEYDPEQFVYPFGFNFNEQVPTMAQAPLAHGLAPIQLTYVVPSDIQPLPEQPMARVSTANGFVPIPPPCGVSSGVQEMSEQTLRCPGCAVSFRHAGDYRRHMKKHGPHRYKCLVIDCPRTFYRADKLRDHLRQGHKKFKLL